MGRQLVPCQQDRRFKCRYFCTSRTALKRFVLGNLSIVGVVLGAVLLQELQNLVNLLGIPSSLNFAVMGTVILLGVLADQQLAAYRAKKRAAQAFERLQPEGAEN